MVVGGYLFGPEFLLGACGVTVLLGFGWRLPKGADGFVADATATVFVTVYVPLMGGFAALLSRGDEGPWRVLAFLACVVASDVGGYASGVLFGRHSMAPRISPKKSWRGSPELACSRSWSGPWCRRWERRCPGGPGRCWPPLSSPPPPSATSSSR